MTEKLSQKNINLIFAVTESVVNLYQVTIPSGASWSGSGVCDGWTYLREPTQTTFGHGPQSGKTWELMITFSEDLSPPTRTYKDGCDVCRGGGE